MDELQQSNKLNIILRKHICKYSIVHIFVKCVCIENSAYLFHEEKRRINSRENMVDTCVRDVTTESVHSVVTCFA